MPIFIVCNDGNTTYKIGDAFVKYDCSEICQCRSYAEIENDEDDEDDDDDDDEDDDDEDDDDEDDDEDDDCDEGDDDDDAVRRRRSIESHIYGKNEIICSPLCASGSSCPVGLVNGTNCFCNRSRCEKRK